MDIKIIRNESPAQLPDENALGFGEIFTDHMFVADYDDASGWHDFRIVPYGPISLSPAAAVFHYGAEVFEGLKAYRTPDGGVQLFRPMENGLRLARSCERIGIPAFPAEDTVRAVEELVRLDSRWVPGKDGTSLYIRPFVFSTDENLSLHGVHRAMYVIVCSPSGIYFGLDPVKIMLETEDVRAVRGGTGEAKCGGNYAASNRAADRAAELGYTQVLWLDGVERKYIEEVGAMNVMFKISSKVVTPKLTGSILPGITRKSCIELIRSWGIEVEERLLSIDELVEAAESGALEEAWGCGTAAVISPIGQFCYLGKEHVINDMKTGELSKRLFDELTGIQYGKRPDPFGWTVRL
jgi:branched-chain amino acid aminotransferase